MSSNRRFKYEPITIKEPHKEEIKTFNDTEEFTQYYRSHEDEFKNGMFELKQNDKTIFVSRWQIQTD